MAQEEQQAKAASVSRVFEQPPDAVVCYADFAQILGTGAEVILQFYESVPGPPSPPKGQVQSIRSRLRATVILSPVHAANIARSLAEQVRQKEAPKP